LIYFDLLQAWQWIPYRIGGLYKGAFINGLVHSVILTVPHHGFMNPTALYKPFANKRYCCNAAFMNTVYYEFRVNP
jgi:hypothetical protein